MRDNDESARGRLVPAQAVAHNAALRIILSYGPDPTRRNRDGKTAADLANERGMFDIAAALNGSSTRQ